MLALLSEIQVWRMHAQKAAPPVQKAVPPAQQDTRHEQTPQGQVVVQQPVVVNAMPLFNAFPAKMLCPYCKENITTVTQPEMGLLAWLVVGGLVITCLWPCACIPCCVDDLKDVNHQCPSCNAILGTYKKI